MTNHTSRLYAVALALVLFFLTWAVIAAQPWAASSSAAADPRLKALHRRELRLRREAQRVDRVVARRWAAYRHALAARRAQIAAIQAAPPPAAAVQPGPSVRVVTLPPLTITRTS